MLNDMKVLLENEMWIPIPVAEDYALRNISELPGKIKTLALG
jgi:hypothetical protein